MSTQTLSEQGQEEEEKEVEGEKRVVATSTQMLSEQAAEKPITKTTKRTTETKPPYLDSSHFTCITLFTAITFITALLFSTSLLTSDNIPTIYLFVATTTLTYLSQNHDLDMKKDNNPSIRSYPLSVLRRACIVGVSLWTQSILIHQNALD